MRNSRKVLSIGLGVLVSVLVTGCAGAASTGAGAASSGAAGSSFGEGTDPVTQPAGTYLSSGAGVGVGPGGGGDDGTGITSGAGVGGVRPTGGDDASVSSDDAVGGAEAPAQEPQDVQVPEPFTVGDITLPAGEILDVAGVDEDHLKAARVEDLEDRDPIHAGRFHRHVRDAAGRQPLGQSVQIAGECREGLDGRGIAIRRHGDDVLGRATIDAGGVRVESFEGRGRWPWLRGAAGMLALHGDLL